MATLYAKTAGGNWSAAATWSNISAAGADNSGPPTAADNVIFELLSGNVTIDAAAACRSLDTTSGTGTYGGVLTHNAFTLTIGDGTSGAGNVALKLNAGMTYAPSADTRVITFASTNGTAQTITWAGKKPGAVTFNGANGSWQLADAFATQSATTTVVTLTNGTLDTNGQTCTWGKFATAAGTKTLTLGSSPVTLTGTGTPWNASATTFTVTANTATVTLSGAGITFAGGGVNYNGLTVAFTGSGVATITGANTFGALTRTGTAALTDELRIANANQTITGALTLGGNTTQGANRLFTHSNTIGTARTLTVGSVVITGDVDFQDITITYSGGSSWTNTGSAYIGDALGNNSTITSNATVAATQTATGTASFSWSTHGWTSRVPLPQDDVVISNAFVAGRTVTADVSRLGHSIDFTGATGTPAFNLTVAVEVYGSLTLISGMTFTGALTVSFFGRAASLVITSGTQVFPGPVIINAPGGTYTLGDSFSCGAGNALTFTNGTFDASTNNVTCARMNSSGNPAMTIRLGSGVWSLAGTGSIQVWGSNGETVVPGTAIIDITATDSGVNKTFAGGGQTFPTLRHRAAGSAKLVITGNNTFAGLDLECTTARTVQFDNAGTTTVTATFTRQGASGQLLTLTSGGAGNTTIALQPGATETTAFNTLTRVIIDLRFTATLTGTSSLASAVAAIPYLTPTLAGTSSLTTTITPYQRFTVSVAGSSTLATTVTPYHRFTAGLAGTSTLAATPTIIPAPAPTTGGDDALWYQSEPFYQHYPQRVGVPRVTLMSPIHLAPAFTGTSTLKAIFTVRTFQDDIQEIRELEELLFLADL